MPDAITIRSLTAKTETGWRRLWTAYFQFY